MIILKSPIKVKIELRSLDSIGSYNETSLTAYFNHNIEVKKNFDNLIRKETNYFQSKKLKAAYQAKFYQNLNMDFYQGFETLTDYLTFNNQDLLRIIREIREIPDKNDREVAINSMIVNLTDIIIEELNNFNVFLGVTTTNILLEYVKKVINVFKSFTVSLLDINVVMVIKNNEYKLFDDMVMRNIRMDIDSFKNSFTLEDYIELTTSAHLKDRYIVRDGLDLSKPFNIKFKEYNSDLEDRYVFNANLPEFIGSVELFDIPNIQTKLNVTSRARMSDRVVIKATYPQI